MSNISYNISSLPGISNIVDQTFDNNKYYSVEKYITKSNEEYIMVKDNKELLSIDQIDTYGLLRCVIFSGPKLVCFSPQKSLPFDKFMLKYRFNEINKSHLLVEEFIEGIMINVFFNPEYGATGCWQIATRNSVGGDLTIYKWSKKTIHKMFVEACIYNKFNLLSLNPRFCYSFVLQHPDYKVVTSFKHPSLYLTNVYEIHQNDKNIIVYEDNTNEIKINNIPGIKYPETYEFQSYTDLIDRFSSGNASYNIMGIIIKNIVTGDRSKIINPIFEEIKHLKGTKQRMFYQYLCLRYYGNVPLYLKSYPNTKYMMSVFRDHVHMFTENLHQNYITCYIKKKTPLHKFSRQYVQHMCNLHKYYIDVLMPNNLYVSNSEVIKYVNNLHPSILMYSLNYNMRKRFIDEKRLYSI